jgi:hypothetical protein
MRHLWLIAVLIFVAVTTASLAVAVGEQLEIPWFAIDGGGTTGSCGGNYCLSVSIGQPMVGASSGGVYTVQGGFWAVAPAPDTGGQAVYLPLIRK